jgi:hypothetical protein
MYLFIIKAYSFKHNDYWRFVVGDTSQQAAINAVEQCLTGDYKIEGVHPIHKAKLDSQCEPFVQEI